jgi:nitrogen fixation protein
MSAQGPTLDDPETDFQFDHYYFKVGKHEPSEEDIVYMSQNSDIKSDRLLLKNGWMGPLSKKDVPRACRLAGKSDTTVIKLGPPEEGKKPLVELEVVKAAGGAVEVKAKTDSGEQSEWLEYIDLFCKWLREEGIFERKSADIV